MKIIVIICVSVLLAAEISLRIAGFGHPLLYIESSAGYEPAPSQVINRLFHYSHYNSHGTRGGEFADVPSSGVVRILSVGDSVANGGTQINDDQTYEAILERKLKADGRNAEILNASAGGYATPNEEKWISEHGIFNAKIVLLEVNEGDLDQPFADSSILDQNISFPSKYPTAAIEEVFTRYLVPILFKGTQTRDPGSFQSGSFDHASAALMLASLGRIKDKVTSEGAVLKILYWDRKIVANDPDTAAQRELLFKWAAGENITVYRPHDAIGNIEGIYRDDIHPNALGNEKIAEYLGPLILGDK